MAGKQLLAHLLDIWLFSSSQEELAATANYVLGTCFIFQYKM